MELWKEETHLPKNPVTLTKYTVHLIPETRGWGGGGGGGQGWRGGRVSTGGGLFFSFNLAVKSMTFISFMIERFRV